LIRLANVSKLYGRFAALREVTCEFIRGRAYVLAGDNGAGKSTLLRVAAGLAQPTSGTVTRNIAAPLGFMAHASMLYDEFTARENLEYFAALYGVSSAEAIDSAIRSVGLDPALKRRVSEYSQGMRQRLSLARAMVHHPGLLLLDEPFSNLDRASAEAMVQLVGELRDQGKTIVLVTHQPQLLSEVADVFITMGAGRIIDISPTFATRTHEVLA